jgi:Zn-dependent protease
MKFLFYLSFFPGFLVALTVHEAAHALSSKWLGDCYAQKQGRISLNPMRHLSALGTLMMFVIGFGWGKPVPVNIYNYKHPKFYYLLTSLAGPFSNILLGSASIGLLWVINAVCGSPAIAEQIVFGGTTYLIYVVVWWFLYSLVYINVVLAVINLIPIPPLDGSKIWPCLIPGLRSAYSGKTTIIWVILLVVAMRGDLIGKVTNPAIGFVNNLMPNMLEKHAVFPSNYPIEIQAPSGSYGVHYEQTKGGDGDPNEFSANFWLDQPYPAANYKSQLVEKMKTLGWSRFNMQQGDNDADKWKTSDIIVEEGEQYRTLTWSGVWVKENDMFYADISYYADPNSRQSEKTMVVEYIYTITNPKSSK